MSLSGTEIREARTEKRITLRALARELGVTAPFLSDVEHDRRVLNEEHAAKARVFLGIRPRVTVRACVGYGGTFDDAIQDAVYLLRENGHHWSSWTIDQHTVEPFEFDRLRGWFIRHRVVLRVTKGAKKT